MYRRPLSGIYIDRQIYGLFKYVTTGAGPSVLPFTVIKRRLISRTSSRPSIFSMQARAKHDAWVTQSQKHSEVEEAKGRYIELAKEIGWEGGKSGQGGAMGGVKVSTMAQDTSVNEEGETSELHEAVIDGKVEEVERLVKGGGDVDSKDEYVRPSMCFGRKLICRA
jgi:hypothetical protein